MSRTKVWYLNDIAWYHTILFSELKDIVSPYTTKMQEKTISKPTFFVAVFWWMNSVIYFKITCTASIVERTQTNEIELQKYQLEAMTWTKSFPVHNLYIPLLIIPLYKHGIRLPRAVWTTHSRILFIIESLEYTTYSLILTQTLIQCYRRRDLLPSAPFTNLYYSCNKHKRWLLAFFTSRFKTQQSQSLPHLWCTYAMD